MDLKMFVSESITQISQGLQLATISNPNVLICPKIAPGKNGEPIVIEYDNPENYKPTPQSISFDVAVTAARSGTGSIEGTMKILVAMVTIDGKAEATLQNSTVSRIKFEIPILWKKA